MIPKVTVTLLDRLKAWVLDDILIAVVDGLSSLPKAIDATYPQTMVQTCFVHLIRNAMA